jgi:hypothetical protein
MGSISEEMRTASATANVRKTAIWFPPARLSKSDGRLSEVDPQTWFPEETKAPSNDENHSSALAAAKWLSQTGQVES